MKILLPRFTEGKRMGVYLVMHSYPNNVLEEAYVDELAIIRTFQSRQPHFYSRFGPLTNREGLAVMDVGYNKDSEKVIYSVWETSLRPSFELDLIPQASHTHTCRDIGAADEFPNFFQVKDIMGIYENNPLLLSVADMR